MEEEALKTEPEMDTETSFWGTHRFMLLITMTVVIASILVVISMTLYSTSGAAQLDLSRPGYRGVASQAASNDNNFGEYANSGPINSDSVNQFKTLYEKQAAAAQAVDAYAGDPLNPDSLGISDPTNN